jgi:hypothetical protein
MALPTYQSAELSAFLRGKTPEAIALFEHFIEQWEKVGTVGVFAAKTMVGISNGKKRVAYITQVGKNFIHVVFMFDRPYEENMCFQKIALVPGTKQYNHHLRILGKQDVNKEVLSFMKMAFEG